MTHRTREPGFAMFAAPAFVLFTWVPLVANPGAPLAPVTPPAGDANFYLDGAGANILAGVYTSPYNAVINPSAINGSDGKASGGTSIPVICDDFANDSFIDEDWDAVVTNLSSLTSTTPSPDPLKWGDSNKVIVNDTSQANAVGIQGFGLDNTTTPLTQVQAYDVAALLAIDISNIANTTGNPTQLGDYSYAMWALFETSAALGQLSSGCPGSSNCALQNAAETQAIKDLYYAVTEVTDNAAAVSSELTNYRINIYSYDQLQGAPSCYPPTTSSGPDRCPNAPPQEFLTVTRVPEPSSLTVFAVYLLFAGVSCFFFGQRRMFKTNR